MPALVSGRIPPLAEIFVPRYETGLTSAVSVPPGTAVVLVTADGAGTGTGKTQMAASMARELSRDRGVGLVLWIPAATADAVISGYAQALRDVGAPPGAGAEQAAAQFAAWLAAQQVPWVVVLDDLRAGAVPDGLWPRGPAGRVLVTTADPDAVPEQAARRVIRVGPFSPREAMGYLSAHLHTDAALRTGALELARDLAFWPLALGQAATVMTANGVGCRDYHARLTEYRASLGPSGELADLAAAWMLGVRAADAQEPAGMASRALGLVSLLAPHGIPGVVLTSPAACQYLAGRPGASADRAQATQAVHNLARSGLVTVDGHSAASTVLVHPAVQSLARQYTPAAERGGLARAAADALLQAWSLPDAPAAVAQRLRDAAVSLHRLAGRLLWEGGCHAVLLEAGRSLQDEGADGQSIEYWRGLLAASEQLLGPGHADTIMIREELGAACEASGRLEDAIAVYEQNLSDSERAAAGAGSGETARVALARAYHAAGRGADAVRLAQDALDEVESTRSPVSDQLSAQEELARAYLDAGQTAEAVTAFRQVLAGRERAQGPDHPMTITARGELAAAYRAAGQPKEAVSLTQRALADCERRCGGGHPETVAARSGLAASYQAAKKHKQAIPLYQRVLADRERIGGPDHADTIEASADLAGAYLAAGRLAQAVTQHEATLAACQRVFGPGHPRTREAIDSLNAAAARGIAVRGIDLRSRVSQ
jgi:tetratricopeptide (TPR) repeat protein